MSPVEGTWRSTSQGNADSGMTEMRRRVLGWVADRTRTGPPHGCGKRGCVVVVLSLCPLLLIVNHQLALVPAFGRQRRAMLILVCWAMLILSCRAMPILFLPGIIRIKPQYLSDILKHFQFQSQKKSMNQIKFLSTSVNTTFVVLVLFCSYWSYYSAWWSVLCVFVEVKLEGDVIE